MNKFLAAWLSTLLGIGYAAEAPLLPGQEVTDASLSSLRSAALVQPVVPDTVLPDSSSWTAASIDEQLSGDRTLVGMGMGAIFVPVMTEPRVEPEVLVTNLDGSRDWSSPAGTRIVLEPGTYTVRIGSGSFRQKQVFKAVVEEGHTTVVRPAWAGMVVETRNEDGDWVDEEYEVYRLVDGESFGGGYGQTQERLKDLRTWILPPGIYRIVRSGEDFGSPRNYITVELNPGQLSQVELVFEASTGNLVAGGVRAFRLGRRGDSPWQWGMRIAGSVLYSSISTRTGKESDAWNVLGDTRLRAIYDHNAWYGSNELSIRSDFQWADDEAGERHLSILGDNLQVQSSWVRRITEWLGPYTRATLKTHLVRAEYFNAEDTLYRVNSHGDTLRSFGPLERFEVRPPFYPLRLGEGIGVDVGLPGGRAFEISAQGGIAWRQVFNDGVLIAKDKKGILWGPEADERSFGLEGTLFSRLRLGRSATLDLRGEVFFPDADPERMELETATMDLRFALAKNIEVAVLEEILDRGTTSEEVVAGGPRFALRSGVQLRLSINY